MRRKLASITALVISLAIGGVTASAQKTKQTPEDAIRGADQVWLKVFAAKDMPATLDMCLPNASVLAPNVPIATGRDAIAKLFGGFFALPGFSVEWVPTRIEVAGSGDLGYTSGTYKLGFTGPDTKAVTDTGKYITIWKKQANDGWKVVLDTFNSDLPAMGTK